MLEVLGFRVLGSAFNSTFKLRYQIILLDLLKNVDFNVIVIFIDYYLINICYTIWVTEGGTCPPPLRLWGAIAPSPQKVKIAKSLPYLDISIILGKGGNWHTPRDMWVIIFHIAEGNYFLQPPQHPNCPPPQLDFWICLWSLDVWYGYTNYPPSAY